MWGLIFKNYFVVFIIAVTKVLLSCGETDFVLYDVIVIGSHNFGTLSGCDTIPNNSNYLFYKSNL
ncbi:hypothetical protein SAMN05444395_101538 [Flavobacterium fryxellicola]|uniref:Uncharacterized protein n=1 Tax=Flavobacterium fryxellicola TaxID=249352 RepID=A0A168AH67_9FLAO|nr:hypothetical protein FBFR_01160 [Flavobacterium fryxellicola]SHN53503.1 hypothetical protein SAMN05444395_101538 [Flavobacterium fryxellicola]